MGAALTQLSQGLASGTLRGEELNSVMEQTPRLAQALAQGMGVSIGQLRAMGAEGRITSLAVIEATAASVPA
jgi:tape measure domain-containing protein